MAALEDDPSVMAKHVEKPLEQVVVQHVSKEGEAAKDDIPPVPFLKLFSTADAKDFLLMAVGAIGAIGNGLLLPLFALVLGQFTDSFGAPDSSFADSVSSMALKFLYLALGAAVGSYLEAGVWMYAGNRQANRLRQLFLAGVLRQEVAFFDTQASAGGLLQRLNEDSLEVQAAMSEKLGGALHHFTTFFGGFIIGFVRGWDMTLVMLGCMPFLALIGGLLAKGTAKANAATAAAYAEASSIAQQSVSQIRTVAAYGREGAAMAQYEAALEGPRRMGLRQAWMSGLSLGAISLVVYGAWAVGLLYGAYRVAAGAYSGGVVLQVLTATLMGGFSLGQAAPSLQTIAKGRAAAGRMFAVIERTPAIGGRGDEQDEEQPGEGAAQKAAPLALAGKAGAAGRELQPRGPAGPSGSFIPPAPLRGELRFVSVHFAYPARPAVAVLRGLDLTLHAGATLALVGASGSGKSTAVQLAERFYDPSQGAVLLDGRDLRDYNLRWLRGQMGLVSQEPTLFATTIGENIAMARPGASGEEVEAAARAANAHGFVAALPLGYETQVGERGVQLSGGQKQRIAIARAILKDPKILLLDEATSALDAASERRVSAALEAAGRGRSVLVVAHRLSTVAGADAIAVLAGGQVVETGRHAELMAREGGAYATLVRLQVEAQQRVKGERPAAEAEAQEGEEDEHRVAAMYSASQGKPGSAAALPAPGGSRGGKPAWSGPSALEMTPSAKLPPGSVAVAIPGAMPAPASWEASDGGGVGAEGGAARATHGSGRQGAGERPAGGHEAERKGKDEKGAGQGVKEEPYKVPFSRLASYARGEGAAAALGCVASAVCGAQHPTFALVMASMITIFYELTGSALRRRADLYTGLFLVIAACASLGTLVQQAAFGRVAQAVAGRIRVQLFGAILRQEIGWFDDPGRSSGVLAAGLATDAAAVRGAVGDVVGVVASNAATLAIGYGIALAYDWRMALLITGVLPAIIAGGIIHMRFHTGFHSDADKLYAGANQQVTEAFTSIRVIQAYNLQTWVEASYQKMLSGANALLVRQSHVAGAAFAFSQFTMMGMYALIVYFMGQEIRHGWSDFGNSFKAFIVMLLAAAGTGQSSMAFPDLGAARSAVQRVFPIMDRRPAIDSGAEEGAQPEPEAVRGEVEFRAVRFAYPSRPSVLVFRDFSLAVHAGQVTALVGESGSGKSSCVGLLQRFYDPLAGAVLLDGRDLRDYNLRWLRGQMGLVSQEPLLFNGTVRDNILIGKQGASQEEVVAAAEVSHAHGFVFVLPEGYDTRVGEGGVQLSGGQKQRIAIARAVIRNPKILLLDEATSALDAASEAEVQAALERVMGGAAAGAGDGAGPGRTCLVIAHRLSTVRSAAAIAVLSHGSVVERGSHAQLLALPGGAYARLVAAQRAGGGGGALGQAEADGS